MSEKITTNEEMHTNQEMGMNENMICDIPYTAPPNSDWVVNFFIPLAKQWRLERIEAMKGHKHLKLKLGMNIMEWLDNMKSFVLEKEQNRDLYLIIKYLVNYDVKLGKEMFTQCKESLFWKCGLAIEELIYVVRDNLKQIYIAANYYGVLYRFAVTTPFKIYFDDNFWKQQRLTREEYKFIDLEITLYAMRHELMINRSEK